ncbi:MAG: nucleotidyltransferase domain-containing protein [Candidatus Helarchaeota archaeon]
MTREKIAPKHFIQEVIYSDNDWVILRKKREKARNVMEVLKKFNIFVHGSIARGDVHENSDIDFIIPDMINEFELIKPLSSIGIHSFQERKIVQATPLSAIKAVITLYDEISITFPLIPFYPREFEFYKFGGQLNFKDLELDIRVPGINKKLVYISPNKMGHEEIAVTEENASTFAKNLNISINTILERIRVLERRDKVGRTGIFYHKILGHNNSFGEMLKEMNDKNPASRRRIRRKKI